jgi:hypothetical protein
MSFSIINCPSFRIELTILAVRYHITFNNVCLDFDKVLSRNTYKYSGLLMSMTTAEMYAVSLYSFNMIYSQLNADLRKGNLDSVSGYVSLLSSALSKHCGYNNTAPVYRGMTTTPDFARNANPDAVVVFNGFTSTTPSENVARRFTEGFTGKSCLFIFTAVGGCEISNLSLHLHENEILFSPGLMFVITSSEVVNGLRLVKMHQVFSTDGFGSVIQS